MRTHLLARCLIGAATTLALAATTKEASAQQPPIALNRFEPAPAGDRFFGVQSPYAAGKATPHLMLLGDYAHNPLVLRWNRSGNGAGEVVTNQLFMHLNGGFSLFDRINVNVNLPIALYQDGNSPTTAGGTSFMSPSKAEIGDLRLGLRVRLLGEYHDPFQVAVGGYVWVPTGSDSAGSFVGDGKVRGLPQLIVGGRVADRFIYTAAAGPELRSSDTFGGVSTGTTLTWGAGAGVLLLDNRHLQLGVEANGGVTLRDVQKRNTNAEILGSVRYRVIDNLEIGAGAGPGLTSGIGTPDFRGVLMVAFTPEQKQARDSDGDGILDADDACPDVKGVSDPDPKKHGCPPPPDRDGDGIIDSLDACPDVKGVASSDPQQNGCPPDRDGDGIIDALDACPDVKGVSDPDPKKSGCPPDRDGDGILDADDACPDVKGVASSDPKKNGCPPPVDTDGDGIFDDEDACPNEKGERNPDPKQNGCPKAVRVSEGEIFILEQVQFDTGKSTIKKVSDPLLDEVASVLQQHPEITKIEVQGHTDNQGKAASNKTLSQARSEAVVTALVKRGIDKTRLTAKGFGQEKPIAPNETAEGRQKNRRVQFAITEKAPKTAKP